MTKLCTVIKKFIGDTPSFELIGQEVAIGDMKKCITIKLTSSGHIKYKFDSLMIQFRENMKPVTGWKIEFNDINIQSSQGIGFRSTDSEQPICYNLKADTWEKHPDYEMISSMISDLVKFTGVFNNE